MNKYTETPSTPTRKRSSSATQDDNEFDTRIHGSQKRLRIIEEALKTPLASSQPSNLRQVNEVTSPSKPFRPHIMAPQIGATSSRSVLPVTPKSSQESLGYNSSQLLQGLSPSIQGDESFEQRLDSALVRDQTRTPGRREVNDGHELTADSIGDMIHKFAEIPDYIRKLERKKIAAEKSRDARDSKISILQAQVEDLKQEVESLKAREKELEDVLATYEHQ